MSSTIGPFLIGLVSRSCIVLICLHIIYALFMHSETMHARLRHKILVHCTRISAWKPDWAHGRWRCFAWQTLIFREVKRGVDINMT